MSKTIPQWEVFSKTENPALVFRSLAVKKYCILQLHNSEFITNLV